MTEHNETNENVPSPQLQKETIVLAKDSVDAHSFVYAGFWMRFWAYLADLIIIWSLNHLLVHPIFKIWGKEDTYSFISGEVIGTTIVFYVYFLFMTKYFQQTLGKMIFGLKVVGVGANKLTWSTLIFREVVGRFISKVTFIGYALVGLLPKKQGLHDIFADTSVVLTRR